MRGRKKLGGKKKKHLFQRTCFRQYDTVIWILAKILSRNFLYRICMYDLPALKFVVII